MKVDDQREAFWLFKKDDKYYMTYDGPVDGWDPIAITERRTAWQGPWTEEKEIGMDPAAEAETKPVSRIAAPVHHEYRRTVDLRW